MKDPEPPSWKSCFVDNNCCCRFFASRMCDDNTWTERPASVTVTDNGRGPILGGRTMLLNTTIHALFASTQAVAAHVIAGLFVRSASPAVFAVVPKQKGSMRDLRWRYLHGQPASDSKQCCGGFSNRCLNSLNRSFSSFLENPERALNQGLGCLTGISGRS